MYLYTHKMYTQVNPKYSMKILTRFKLLSFIALFSTNIAFAYDSVGHTIIAQIAYNYLDTTTQQNVLNYLKGTSFDDAAVWMDEIKSDKSMDYMRPWHYINIPKGEVYMPDGEDNIIFQLNKALKDFDNLKSLKNDQIKIDLLLVFHLMGDLHQPLHVGYGIDRGGNDMQVNIAGRGTNLHKVWDEMIIQKENITLESCMAYAATIPPNEFQEIKNINVIQWMNESRSLLDTVYKFNGHKMDEKYLSNMKPVVEKLLVHGGIRLAAVLEKYFKNPAIQAIPLSKDTIKITDAEAKDHIGEMAVVCGKVFTTKFFDGKGKKPTFLNLGASYPNQSLTIVIFEKDRPNFDYEPDKFLLDKNVCVTGRIKLYKGKVEVIISEPDQMLIQ